MKHLKEKMNEFWKDESGQGLLEYILLVTIVVAAVIFLRPRVKTWLDSSAGKVDSGLGGIDTNL